MKFNYSSQLLFFTNILSDGCLGRSS